MSLLQREREIKHIHTANAVVPPTAKEWGEPHRISSHNPHQYVGRCAQERLSLPATLEIASQGGDGVDLGSITSSSKCILLVAKLWWRNTGVRPQRAHSTFHTKGEAIKR
jgi:hypothetical protein